MPDRVYRLCLLGLRDSDLAVALGVDITTLELWKQTKEELAEAINQGRIIADSHVAQSLYKKAIGYSHPDTHIAVAFNRQTQQTEIIQTEIVKHYPPDSWAAFKWLSIRQREHWMDVQKVEHHIHGQVTHTLSESLTQHEDISEEELELALKLGMIKLKKETVPSQN